MTSKPKPERQIKFKLNKEDRSGNGEKKREKKNSGKMLYI